MPVGAARTRISLHEALRRQRGLLNKDIAEGVPCSHPYVSLIEGGLKPASARYRKAVAEMLRVPEDVIFDEDGWVR